jgi:hypothetical protein
VWRQRLLLSCTYVVSLDDFGFCDDFGYCTLMTVPRPCPWLAGLILFFLGDPSELPSRRSLVF